MNIDVLRKNLEKVLATEVFTRRFQNTSMSNRFKEKETTSVWCTAGAKHTWADHFRYEVVSDNVSELLWP